MDDFSANCTYLISLSSVGVDQVYTSAMFGTDQFMMFARAVTNHIAGSIGCYYCSSVHRAVLDVVTVLTPTSKRPHYRLRMRADQSLSSFASSHSSMALSRLCLRFACGLCRPRSNAFQFSSSRLTAPHCASSSGVTSSQWSSTAQPFTAATVRSMCQV